MAPLHRALAFEEMDSIALLVAKNLEFDMMGVLDQLLEIDAAVAKGVLRFTSG